LARKMWVAYNMSIPRKLAAGEWHLPYITDVDRIDVSCHVLSDAKDVDINEVLKKISVGRCARVSYLNHDGVRNLHDDVKLYDRLVVQAPGHWSPLEHVAQAATLVCFSGNIRGWIQLRKTFPQEKTETTKSWQKEDYKTEVDEYFSVHSRGF
jgi:hypothetical protein